MQPRNRLLSLQPALGIVGAVLLPLTFIQTVRGVAFFATHTYELAWWALIAGLDGFVWWRTRRSPIAEDPFRFLLLCLWSVTWWFFFELVNLRLRNWHYIFVAVGTGERWLGTFLSFATVIPGIALFAEALEAMGLFRRRPEAPPERQSLSQISTPSRMPERGIGIGSKCLLPGYLPGALLGLGVCTLVLPLCWPRYFYPLVWGSLLLILDPLNRRLGGRSLLSLLERGTPRPILLYLSAGAAAGLFWECLNYWARIKWIYTVPFFEELKLFEMPLLGFLGFPPFALECWVVMESLAVAGLVPASGSRRAPTRAAALLAAALLCSAAMGAMALLGMDRVTFASLYPWTDDLPGLEDSRREELRRRGIGDCFQLREALSGEGGDSALAARLDLVLLAGIGIEKALALESLGIRSVSDLVCADPAVLSSRLERLKLRHVPTPAEVRYWVRQARRRDDSP